MTQMLQVRAIFAHQQPDHLHQSHRADPFPRSIYESYAKAMLTLLRGPSRGGKR